MELPNLFAHHSSPGKRLLYLAYSDSRVQAFLVQLQDGSLQVLEQSKPEIYTDADSCLVRTDEVLQQLGKGSENLSEVLLGLDPNWIARGEILEQKRLLLKRVFSELSLKPVGFVGFSEALAQHSIRTQPQVSSILAYITATSMVFIWLNKGVIGQAESVGRSSDTLSDFVEGLARFHSSAGGALPSHVLLGSFELSEAELTQVQQELLEYDWQTSQQLRETPVVEVVPADQTVAAVLEESASVLVGSSDHPTAESTTPVDAETQTVEQAAHPAPAAATATSFGIPMKQSSGQPPVVERAVMEDHANLTHPTKPLTETRSKSESSFGKPVSSHMPSLAEDEQQDVPPAAKSIKKFVIGGVVAGLLVLGIGGYFALGFISSATVTAVLSKTAVSEEVEITLDPEFAATSAEERILAAKTVTKELTGDAVTQTSGVKIVGEQATGTVFLFNKTNADKTFEAGTVLSSEAQEFTLDSQVTIPAAVETSGSRRGVEFGQVEVAVTAVKIGDEGNIGKGTQLRVGSFDASSYEAEAKEAFAGGSSREVRVVADADKQELLEEIRRKLLDRANEEFQAESGSGTYILPSTAISITQTKFDAEVGTEANTLTLQATAAVSALSYAASDLDPIAQQVLQDKVPTGFQLSQADPQILSAPLEPATGETAVKLEANISSYAVPQVDTELWKVALTGKTVSAAEEYLKNLEEVSSVTVQVEPAFAQSLYGKLPRSTERIRIVVGE